MATLLRVFPYAGIKFMLYDRVHHVRRPILRLAMSSLTDSAAPLVPYAHQGAGNECTPLRRWFGVG